MAVKKGYKAKIYRNTGTFGTPTWNEVSIVKDVQVNPTFDELEATSRASGGVKEFEPGELTFALSLAIRTDEGSDDYTTFETAWLGKTALDLMLLDGDSATNGSRGYRMEMKVFDISEDQSNGAILYRNIQLKPCHSDNAKQSVVVSSGSPVFTTLVA